MNLDTLAIRNFRGLDNITIRFDKSANVIVGPNAVGKTTVLEALRLVKGTLAPRTFDETQHVFVTLGAISPHNPQRLNYAVLARDPTRSLNITAKFSLGPNEVARLDTMVPELATAMVRASLGPGAAANGPLVLVQYLSSIAGIQALTKAQADVTTQLSNLRNTSRITLDLTIDPLAGIIKGANQIDQLVFSAFEEQLPPHQSLFSYFPADRAMPSGEVAIQVGGADIVQQLQSHNAQPQLKYNRLKPTIINNLLFDSTTREKLQQDFHKIFSRVLKDRALAGTNVTNQFGLISIKIKEMADGRTFDIDQMSSGEKGLILTFLLISNSVVDNGIILLDEPELHLNPAVCKLLLPFLIDEYLLPKNIQAIICIHSPEILGAAFDRKDCSLHHLQSASIISPIYPEDKREVFDALRRLGTLASDVLFSNGSIFVEGDQDAEILETGFAELLSKYKVTQLGRAWKCRKGN
jgi:predicted ATPase